MEELSEKFLEYVSNEKKIDKGQASIFIDKCLKTVSAKLNIPYADVYNAIYNVDFLKPTIAKNCKDISIDECTSDECFQLDGKCYNKIFLDAEKMNADPDQYILNNVGSTEKLAELVKVASYMYYNYKGGGITDNTFDAFEYHLKKRLQLKGRLYEKIGAPPVDKIKVKLPYPMNSLEKIKPGMRELTNFLSIATKTLKDRPIGLVWSLKLDGVSGMIVYKNGIPDKLYTRGDGIVGGDVTYLKEFITLPNLKGQEKNIVVRGEFIVSKRTWEEKYKETYSNARSFVSGKINSGHVTQGLQDIRFVAYEIVDYIGDLSEPSKSFKILEANGFEVVNNGKINDPNTFELITLYKNKRKESEYYIDGLVLSIDVNKQDLKIVNSPRQSLAFKMKLEEQIRSSKVINVEWNLSRYGRYVPVAIYESVYIDGVRLHRASAFNAAHVRDWNMGKGTVIKIIRSGDVIPTIIDVDVDEKIEPIFPPQEPKWHWKGQDIILDDIDNNKQVQIQRITHFFKTIAVPRLRDKTIEKLWNAGYNTIQKITNAKPEDFIKIKGIGKKTSVSHYNNIHTIMRKTRLDRFIPASTTLELGIGRKLVKQLTRYYPGILEDDEETISRTLRKKEIPGFGVKRIANVAANIPKFKQFLYSLNKEDVEFAIKNDALRRETTKNNGYNPKIRGKTFVLTGFLGRTDYELEDYIYDHFGNFSSVVTSSTNAVISANLMEITTKMLTAEQMHIPVYSIDEFVKKYDVPYHVSKDDDDSSDGTQPIEPDDDS